MKRQNNTYCYNKVSRALVCVCAFALYLFGLTGCNNEMDLAPMELELRLAISANGISNPQYAPSLSRNESDTMQLRVFGDPGEAENFEFPDHLYAYLVWSEGGDPEVTHVQVIKTELNPSFWKQESNSSLTYQTKGDSLYVYTQKIFTLLKDKKRVWGKLYVFVSKGEVNLYVKGNPSKLEKDYVAEDVLNLVFDNSSSTIQANLKNLYSTPYNYEVNDKYYGTIANFAYDGTGESESGSRVAFVDLFLYHVAAKVDVMWNVAEGKRSEMKLSYIAAEHLYDGSCLVFRPMENELGVEKYTSGYTRVLATNDIGTQWNGRAYFYTIPYKNNAATKVFPLQLCMLKNGDSPKIPAVPPAVEPTDREVKDYYHLIQNTSMPADAVFMPWIRCQMNINNVLTYSATPVVYPVSPPAP